MPSRPRVSSPSMASPGFLGRQRRGLAAWRSASPRKPTRRRRCCVTASSVAPSAGASGRRISATACARRTSARTAVATPRPYVLSSMRRAPSSSGRWTERRPGASSCPEAPRPGTTRRMRTCLDSGTSSNTCTPTTGPTWPRPPSLRRRRSRRTRTRACSSRPSWAARTAESRSLRWTSATALGSSPCGPPPTRSSSWPATAATPGLPRAPSSAPRRTASGSGSAARSRRAHGTAACTSRPPTPSCDRRASTWRRTSRRRASVPRAATPASSAAASRVRHSRRKWATTSRRGAWPAWTRSSARRRRARTACSAGSRARQSSLFPAARTARPASTRRPTWPSTAARTAAAAASWAVSPRRPHRAAKRVRPRSTRRRSARAAFASAKGPTCTWTASGPSSRRTARSASTCSSPSGRWTRPAASPRALWASPASASWLRPSRWAGASCTAPRRAAAPARRRRSGCTARNSCWATF
mmetsp:Transcript_11187/g.37299  ORF Transcript_11187/g.37299 Transcript_11187/m.37299 type:complete len:472 (-) Transcript_11187:525-1940(-)